MQTKVVEIYDDGSTITLVSDAGDYVSIPKSRLKLKYTPDFCFLYDEFERGQAPIQVEDDCYVLNFVDITTPVTASNLALANILVTYLQISSGGGSAGWLLNGNTEGAEKYIGTNDAFDFPIYTNGVERARITSTGRFGINTPTPAVALDIVSYAADAIGTKITATNITTSGGVGVGLQVTSASPVDTKNYAIEGISSSPYVGNGNTEAYGVIGKSIVAGYTNAGVRGEGLNGAGASYGISGIINSGATTVAAFGTAAIAGVNLSSNSSINSGGRFYNASTSAGSTAYGIQAQTQVGGSITTGVGGRFESTGAASNYAIVTPATGGNIGFGTETPNGRLTIHGTGTTAATFPFIVRNSSSTALFYIYDNGRINASGLPVGNAGLPSGDLYVDTASNILSNADLVVGRKV